MKINKKIIALLLAMIMLFSVGVVTAFAEEAAVLGTEETDMMEDFQDEESEAEQENTEQLTEEVSEETEETGDLLVEDVPMLLAMTVSDSPVIEGLGTEDSPYLVVTEEHLVALATGALQNSLSAYYELQNDIVLSSETWTPIGAQTEFTGVFDGNGHTITGGELFQSTGLSGLFGKNRGTIANLTVVASITDTATAAGLLVGTNYGTIENCHTMGSIASGANVAVGGLVGINYGVVRNCSSYAAVNASTGSAGGLVGTLQGGTIEHSYATGNVSSVGNTAGGLVGYAYPYARGNVNVTNTIKYSYATGTVTGKKAGGLIGYAYTYADADNSSLKAYSYNQIENCYAHGSVTGTEAAGGLIGKAETYLWGNYGASQNKVFYCYAIGVVNEGNGGGLLGAYGGNGANVVSCSYYNAKNVGNKAGFSASEGRMKTEALYYGWDFNHVWMITDESLYPYVQLRGEKEHIAITGSGTVTNPYIIENETQLFALVTGELSGSLYYELGNDITVTARHWTPIGINGTPSFSGVLDGAGHTISGLTLKNTWYSQVGLFATNNGTIKNLNVMVDFDGVARVGGIAANNYGIIDNCTVFGTVSGSGDNYVGGLVGGNYGTIRNCSSSAEVTAISGTAGGIVGVLEGGTIEHSFATGNVSAVAGNAGGLVGYAYPYARGNVNVTNTIKYSYATGTVTGKKAGGLIGYAYTYADADNSSLKAYSYNQIENCYAHGSVTGTETAGGLIGKAETYLWGNYGASQNKVSYCYATGVVNEGNGGGLIGSYNDIGSNIIRYCYYNAKNTGNNIGFRATASKLKKETTYYGWDFDHIWSLQNSTYPYISINGTYNGVDIEGFGDDDDPYLIENEEQLRALVTGELGPATKAYYKLVNDIVVTADHWTPIGNNGTSSFNGVFDGDGHTISGLTLKNTHYNYVGLFGSNVGTIKNLNIVVEFDGPYCVGGIVGSNGGTIENCSVSGTVSSNGNNNIGGITGWNSGTVRKSNASAEVTSASGTAGGLVGAVQNGTIEQSFATGNVSAVAGNAGGLVGYAYPYARGNVNVTNTIKCSYATGIVTGKKAGGLIGYAYTYADADNSSLKAYSYNQIENCYAHGSVTGTEAAGGLIGKAETYLWGNYGASQNKVSYCYATGVVNEGNGGGLIGSYNDIGSNIIRYCYYNAMNTGNRIGFVATGETMQQQSVYFGWDFDHIWSLQGSAYPYIAINGVYEGIDIEGCGDDDDPYLIENEEQLRALVTGEIGPATKAYYKLTKDIVVTANHWTPIGNNGTSAFNGVFDGDGHTISGLTLKNTHYSHVGLFGRNTGTIKNLNVVVDFDGPTYVGGITASNAGTIENCTVSGTVTGNDVGGITGYNAGTIRQCSSSAIVKSNSGSAGGLVGTLQEGGTIEQSFATGNVSAAAGNAGGLVGYAYPYARGNVNVTNTIKYSYATGAVTGKKAGGLIGYAYTYADADNSSLKAYSYNQIENCYAHGSVTGTEAAGGLIGKAETYLWGNYGASQNKVSYCYATGVVSGNNKGGLIGSKSGTLNLLSSYYNTSKSGCSDIDRGTPLSDESMKTAASYVGWDFDITWALSANIADGYPHLKSLVPGEVIPVTGVTMDQTALTMSEGGAAKLTAVIAPQNATNPMVTWTSSNSGVVSVVNGTLTANTVGTAIITAKTVDGGFIASCTVTVTKTSSVLVGDVNGDGEVDFADAILVLKFDAGTANLTQDQQKAADASGDDCVDFVDAILILKYDSGLISSF